MHWQDMSNDLSHNSLLTLITGISTSFQYALQYSLTYLQYNLLYVQQNSLPKESTAIFNNRYSGKSPQLVKASL